MHFLREVWTIPKRHTLHDSEILPIVAYDPQTRARTIVRTIMFDLPPSTASKNSARGGMFFTDRTHGHKEFSKVGKEAEFSDSSEEFV
jgi:hypothetical protein